MRVAFVCKRFYMNHDVIVDRYGRLYQQPWQLALRGHAVLGLAFAYRGRVPGDEQHAAGPGSLRWIGQGMAPLGLGALSWPARALEVLRGFDAQLVVGASDALQIVLADWLAARLGIPHAVDLYDDFESFGLSRLPGLVALYRRSVRRAAVVSCVSELLARRVREDYRALGSVLTLPSTIAHDDFHPRERLACRSRFGLPLNARLIGTAGGLTRAKGIETLYRAYAQLARHDPDLHLVLAGPIDPACPPPTGSQVHHLGSLTHADTAALFAALDVGVVYLRDTPYGRCSFPQKAYEMAACGIPLAVARVGAMQALFDATPEVFYAADDADSLAGCLRRQLGRPVIPRCRIPDWAELSLAMERAYRASLLPRHALAEGSVP